MTDGRRVAAFDFDGTLSRKDSLGPFLELVCGKTQLYRAFARRAPVFAGLAVGIGDRDAEKERLVGRLLAGRSAASVRATGEVYARSLTEGEALRPDMLERLAWHRSEGHEIVIVSASLDAYLEPLAPMLGVHRVFCTRLGIAPDGRLDGRLEGGNVPRPGEGPTGPGMAGRRRGRAVGLRRQRG